MVLSQEFQVTDYFSLASSANQEAETKRRWLGLRTLMLGRTEKDVVSEIITMNVISLRI